MNQSSSRFNKQTLWQCSGCGCVDTQSHILHCAAFQHLREGKSIENDQDLVDYFTQVLKIREDWDWKLLKIPEFGLSGWHEQVSLFITDSRYAKVGKYLLYVLK